MSPTADRRNRFTPIYALWTAVLLFLMTGLDAIDMAFNLWILIIPILMLPILITLIWFATALGMSLAWRRWRRVAAIIAGPPLGFAAALILVRAGYDLTWFRFEWNKSRYLDDLEAADAPSPRYRVWKWGETGGVGVSSSFYTLVFDESDATATREGSSVGAANTSSPSVQSGTVAAGGWESWVWVRHLEGHFYLVREMYD